MISSTVIGNLGNNPETRETKSGQKVTSFNVASNKGKDETTWVRCSAWGKQGEIIAQHFAKGDKIAVAGSLSVREYQDKSGQTRTSLDLDVRDFTFVGGGTGGGKTDAQAAAEVAGLD